MPRSSDAGAKAQMFAEVFPFWSLLSQSQQLLFMNNAAMTCYPEGARCYGVPQQFHGVIALHSGSARVFLLSEDGREATLFQLHPRELFMLPLAFPQGTGSMVLCFAFEENSELISVQERAVFVLSHTVPAVEQAVFDASVAHLQKILFAAHVQSFYSLRRRLALLLLEQCGENPEPVVLRTTHDELARALRSAREIISLELGRMQKDGIVKTGRGKITVLKKNALKNLADDHI